MKTTEEERSWPSRGGLHPEEDKHAFLPRESTSQTCCLARGRQECCWGVLRLLLGGRPEGALEKKTPTAAERMNIWIREERSECVCVGVLNTASRQKYRSDEHLVSGSTAGLTSCCLEKVAQSETQTLTNVQSLGNNISRPPGAAGVPRLRPWESLNRTAQVSEAAAVERRSAPF